MKTKSILSLSLAVALIGLATSAPAQTEAQINSLQQKIQGSGPDREIPPHATAAHGMTDANFRVVANAWSGAVYLYDLNSAFRIKLIVPSLTANVDWTLPSATTSVSTPGATVITPGATPAWTLGATSLYTLTPAEAESITATLTAGVIGRSYFLKVTTSGTSSFVLTFSTGIKSTGTLTTGTVSAKIFMVHFLYDGTQLVEVSRTAAQ